MIKTVKVKKRLRLDELIKYVRDNGINSQAFVSDAGRASVYFDSEQNISLGEYTYGELDIERTFTVEVEEKITEESLFGSFVVITENGTIKTFNNTYNMREIRDLLENYENEQKIYALIDNNLELIWEAE